VSDALRVGGFLAPVFAAAAVGTAFLPAFLVTRGLDAASIGTLLAVGTVVRMLAVPVWGVMADRSGRTPVVLMAGCVVAPCAVRGLPSVQYRPHRCQVGGGGEPWHVQQPG
jgi:MFS family permease